MSYSHYRIVQKRETRSAAALLAFAVASLIVVGVLFYMFSEQISTASNSAAITATGQGVAGPSGKGTVAGQQGTPAREGGGTAPSNR
jgi:hypothetical protein